MLSHQAWFLHAAPIGRLLSQGSENVELESPLGSATPWSPPAKSPLNLSFVISNNIVLKDL